MNFVIGLSAVLFSLPAAARDPRSNSSGHVNSSNHSGSGHTTKNGTTVKPHRQTSPNTKKGTKKTR
jgi:hypothetical protein